MNKEHNSYEDESPLSYDNYAARQRVEKWESKKVCQLEEHDIAYDLAEAEGIAEALWLCAVAYVVVLAALVLLTN